MNCKHFNFSAHVSVGRLTSEDNPEEVKNYMADIKIKCNDCGLPFTFLGLPGGMSFTQPMVNVGATEARMPIIPGSIDLIPN